MRAEIDGELLAEVRRMADEQGRSERELLDEAVRTYLLRCRAGLKELFEDAACWQRERGIDPLSDEEAMRLANDGRVARHEAREEGPDVARVVVDPNALVSAPVSRRHARVQGSSGASRPACASPSNTPGDTCRRAGACQPC